MMMSRHTSRTSQLQGSSDSEDLPLKKLIRTTSSEAGTVSDGTAGSYGCFRPRATSTPKVLDDLKPTIRTRSERLKRKRSSVFRMPSRKDVFEKITESPNKCYSHLLPRSLINNYLRERHRYNYDPASTSGESSIDEFIDDDNDDDSDSDVEDCGRQIQFTTVKQKRVRHLQPSSSPENHTQIHNEANHKWSTKRRNLALKSDSSDDGDSEVEQATQAKKRSRGSVLLITSSDDDKSGREEVTSTRSATESQVDSGIGGTRLEENQTNTTGELASMRLGSTGHDSSGHTSEDTGHCLDSDTDSDSSSMCIRQKLHACKRNKIMTDDSDTSLDAGVSSPGKAVEEDTGSRDERVRKSSQRVQTLAWRKHRRDDVLMAYREQRKRRVK